jgi:PAS domain S-box-containing protein
LDLLGYTKKEISKLNYYASFLSDNDLKIALKTLKELIRTGKQKDIQEYTLRRKDGTFVFVSAIVSLIYQNGEPVAIHGLAVDITHRKRVEAALRNSEKKYRAIMNHAPDAILIIDTNGHVIDSNPKL